MLLQDLKQHSLVSTSYLKACAHLLQLSSFYHGHRVNAPLEKGSPSWEGVPSLGTC